MKSKKIHRHAVRLQKNYKDWRKEYTIGIGYCKRGRRIRQRLHFYGIR